MKPEDEIFDYVEINGRTCLDIHMSKNNVMLNRLRNGTSLPPKFSVGPWNSPDFNRFLAENPEHLSSEA